jgi:hypothetical protein
MTKVEKISKVCHETNRAFCESIGDNTQPTWENAEDWQIKATINGVMFHLENHDAKPDHSHNDWVRTKVEDGWVYGEIKDPVKKTHPCIVKFSKLPIEQQIKDFLFKSVVDSMRNLPE